MLFLPRFESGPEVPRNDATKSRSVVLLYKVPAKITSKRERRYCPSVPTRDCRSHSVNCRAQTAILYDRAEIEGFSERRKLAGRRRVPGTVPLRWRCHRHGARADASRPQRANRHVGGRHVTIVARGAVEATGGRHREDNKSAPSWCSSYFCSVIAELITNEKRKPSDSRF